MSDRVNPDEPWDRWVRVLDEARSYVEEVSFEHRAETSINSAKRVLAMAYQLAGVSCHRCGGYGTHTYGSGSTWRGGVGGQMMTMDVCDVCWGTGRNDEIGHDLRRCKGEHHESRSRDGAAENSS